MKVLVTGAAGFIGRHLCAALVARGDDVTGLDREPQPDELPYVKWVRGDVAEERLWMPPPFDCVYHLAGNAAVAAAIESPHVDLTENAVATARLLHGLATSSAPPAAVVFASSDAVTDVQEVHQFADEGYGPCLPISTYGASKLAAEGFVSAYAESAKFAALIVRLGNVVGGGMTYNVLVDLMKNLRQNDYAKIELRNDGQTRRQFALVDDVVRALIDLPRPAPGGCNVVNVAGPDEIRIVDVATLIGSLLGDGDVEIALAESPQSWPGDARRTALDVSKAVTLGWEPSVSSTAAVQLAIRRLAPTYCPERAALPPQPLAPSCVNPMCHGCGPGGCCEPHGETGPVRCRIRLVTPPPSSTSSLSLRGQSASTLSLRQAADQRLRVTLAPAAPIQPMRYDVDDNEP